MTDLPDLLTPSEVLAQVAAALPDSARSSVIIIGSLAAGYHFFAGNGEKAIRTKDVDCLFTPHAKAVTAAAEVTEQLLQANWTQRKDGEWGEPGKPGDPVENLPMVRLKPPGGSKHWFVELLAAPPAYKPGSSGKKLQVVSTSAGEFAICSFDFLALTEWAPLPTKSGLRIARPEMMALANLLHHPTIAASVIKGTDYKRSNKDLGRVLALAHLTLERDRRQGSDELGEWATRMEAALLDKFDAEALPLTRRVGNGIDALMKSEADLSQALHIANIGLLASMDVGLDEIRATGRRLQAEVLEPLSVIGD